METPKTFELKSIKEKLNYNISYTAVMPSLQDDEYIDQTIQCLFKQKTKDILYSIIIVISNCENNESTKSTLKKILMDLS